MADLTKHAKSVVEAFNNQDWDGTRKLLGGRDVHRARNAALS